MYMEYEHKKKGIHYRRLSTVSEGLQYTLYLHGQIHGGDGVVILSPLSLLNLLISSTFIPTHLTFLHNFLHKGVCRSQ